MLLNEMFHNSLGAWLLVVLLFVDEMSALVGPTLGLLWRSRVEAQCRMWPWLESWLQY